MDHIHAINQLIEKSNKPLYMAFIDYEKAFDLADTAELLETIRDQGVELTSIALLEDVFMGCTSAIVLHKRSEKFPIRKGVREGDTISSKLFTACLETVFRRLDCRSREYG